jgi:serine/threonine-protein kinase
MLTEGTYLADRYEIVSKVGAGGMSDVYKAKDHILGRFVAIKVLKQEFSEDRNFVTKFRTEAQSAAGLEHPNIVNIYDVGSEEGLHYIVMEYVEGITLKTYIEKKGQLSFKESVSIAIQVSRGIEAAHNKKIIHRDIKPQNIIISTEGKVKVTDFGIAKAASANTISSDVMGSVHYASPEQARNGYVDARSDIYSLGIVMYEMVTGRVPFDGDTTVAVAIQHLQEEMTSPKTYAPSLPVSMEKIILKCAQKNPDRRYQTIADLLADLRKSLISPEEDFVVIAPVVDSGKTKVISEEEIQQIKNGVSPVAKKEAEKPVIVAPTPVKEYENKSADEDEEDEDEDALSPAMDKAVTIFGIIFAVLIVIVIIVLAMKVSRLFGGSSSPSTQGTEAVSETSTGETENTEVSQIVTMINILGMSYADAEEALREIGLSINVSAMDDSSDEADGTVLSASVDEGLQVQRGSVIDVVIAGHELSTEGSGDPGNGSTSNTVIVPSVVGYSETTATSALQNAGLTSNTTYEYSSDVAKGEVINQDPVAGSSVANGSTVTLVVSQGIEQVSVPDVLGLTKDKATKKLEDKGLTVTVVEDYSDEVKEGRVISQSVDGGESVNAGSDITITVSLGKKTVLYSFSMGFSAPGNATGVSYTLTTEDGAVISSGSDNISGGSTYTISQINIEAASGYLELTWTVESEDEDGNTFSEEESGFNGTVDFTAQQ